MGFGVVAAMRKEFANQLRPYKGGASGIAEIKRRSNQFASSIPAERVNVHYERLSTDPGSRLDLELGSMPGFQVFFDGHLATPLVNADLIVVNGITMSVLTVNEVGNLTPIASVNCAVR